MQDRYLTLEKQNTCCLFPWENKQQTIRLSDGQDYIFKTMNLKDITRIMTRQKISSISKFFGSLCSRDTDSYSYILTKIPKDFILVTEHILNAKMDRFKYVLGVFPVKTPDKLVGFQLAEMFVENESVQVHLEDFLSMFEFEQRLLIFLIDSKVIKNKQEYVDFKRFYSDNGKKNKNIITEKKFYRVYCDPFDLGNQNLLEDISNCLGFLFSRGFTGIEINDGNEIKRHTMLIGVAQFIHMRQRYLTSFAVVRDTKPTSIIKGKQPVGFIYVDLNCIHVDFGKRGILTHGYDFWRTMLIDFCTRYQVKHGFLVLQAFNIKLVEYYETLGLSVVSETKYKSFPHLVTKTPYMISWDLIENAKKFVMPPPPKIESSDSDSSSSSSEEEWINFSDVEI